MHSLMVEMLDLQSQVHLEAVLLSNDCGQVVYT